ncbi:SET domain family protein [Leishmania donovani]|uniref:SET domain family protein n=1 Tax=Leishmania donovani TaxID=5661 RepID=A0A504X7U9_LEIDO|nr:SET domain family protein [Leishmania donovani]
MRAAFRLAAQSFRLCPAPGVASSLSLSTVASSAFRGSLLVTARSFAKVSSVQGKIEVPPGGFVTADVRIDMNASFGGSFARGVFAEREIGYGREVMNLPAYCMYISENDRQPLREQVLIMTKEIFSKVVYGTPQEQQYRDVFDFAEEVRAPGADGAFRNGCSCLMSGEFSSYDLQKLPLIVEFNRFEVDYRGRRGICLFPEASYLNHSCEPNVELSITYNSIKNNFFLSARAVRPILEGEELFINYMPGNNLPLSRLALAMKKRWGFECSCVKCKSRAVGAVTIVFVVLLIPIIVYIRRFIVERTKEKHRSL